MSLTKRLSILVLAVGSLCVVTPKTNAQLVINYDFTPNIVITDNGQITLSYTLGGLSGLSTFTNTTVRLNLTSASGDTMWLGDLYSTLTFGSALAGETTRTAVLLNRPGRDNTNEFGSSLSSLNVTLDESAASNIWGTTSTSGTYKSDGRLGVSPYGAAVAFSNGDRTNTLTALNGTHLNSNLVSLLLADTSAGNTAMLSSWGVSVTGTAATSGTFTPFVSGATTSLSDTGTGAVNNIGATLDTTGFGSGATGLLLNFAGSATFSGGITGTGGIIKQGVGTVTLPTANTYSGGTVVSAGKLFVTNTTGSGTGTGAVTVSNSGTVLGGTGIISGAVTINSGAILEAGTGSTGQTLTLSGNLTMNSGSIIELALGPSFTHSTLARTGGTWSFQSNQAFTFINLGATTGTYDNIITGLASDPGTESTWTITGNQNFVGTFTYDGLGNIDLNLIAVPEPGTWIAAALALGSVLYNKRRRIFRFPRVT
jgi:autotransporter-associated beta strand protein